MSEDYYQIGRRKQEHKVLHPVKWFLIGLFVALPAIAVILLFTGAMFTKEEADPVKSEQQTVTQTSTNQVFKSPFFQFQANKSWTENARASVGGMYVYQSFRGPLVEHDLRIEVNPDAKELGPLRTSRIQPVALNDEGGFDVRGDISEHCGSKIKTTNQNPRQIIVEGVTFMCHVDGNIFDVRVGEVGGTPIIKMKRPDGSVVTFTIYYRDLRADTDGRELKQIVKTFQTR